MRRIPGSLATFILVFPLAAALPRPVAAASRTVPEAAADQGPAIRRALIRLEDDFRRWSALVEHSRRTGAPVDTRGWTRDDFQAQVDALGEQAAALGPERGADLLSKVRAVRDRVRSWEAPSDRAAARDVRARTPYGPIRRATAVSPGASCVDALPLAPGVFGWENGEVGGVAWFRFVAGAEGGVRLHTGGSRADTELALFERCGGPPIAVDDDAIGLQSALVAEVPPGAERWLRVAGRGARGRDSVVLTLEGTGAGGLGGTVVDEVSGLPLQSVRLQLYNDSGSYFGSQYTSSSGAYAFGGLPPDSYYLRTTNLETHLNEVWDDHPCEPSCSVFEGDPIVVADTLVDGIDFALTPAAHVSGTVLETGGGPIDSGSVRLVDGNGYTVDYDYPQVGGFYEVYAKIPGTYFLYTSVSDYRNEVWDDIPCEPTCQPTEGTPLPLSPGDERPGTNFVLDRNGGISGRITDAQTGQPVVSAQVRVYTSTGGYSGAEYSEPDGTWEIQGLLPGTYFVATNVYGGYRNEVWDDIPCTPSCDPTSGQGVHVELSETTPGIDFALDRLGAVTGTVRDEVTQLPLGGLRLEIWNDTGATVEVTTTTPLGHYEMLDLQPGTYFVVTSDEGPYIDELYLDIACPYGPPAGCDPLTGTPLPVALTQVVEDVDLDLGLGASITGTLTDERTGDALPSRTVALWRANGALQADDFTRSGGEYFFSGLVSGTYFVTTATGTHLDELWDDLPCEPTCDPTTGTPIAVQAPGAVGGVDFDLALLGGLAGTVTDDDGLPVEGVNLHAWSSQGYLYGTGTTRADGSYQIDLPSGIFYLSTHNTLGLPEELWDNVRCPDGPAILGLCDPLEGDPITVVGVDPVMTGLDFTLGTSLFADGFESGDASAWSQVVP